ncbi:MAG: precorrin-6y C5,15-methyltransferase (decarboxylating) subunit CbiE [Cellvibrionales bacterium]|nr:precorrin-6y C5,15-methyltransferase (decarboxylating) subunit CbiE [Cellvibrionales bacterium]
MTIFAVGLGVGEQAELSRDAKSALAKAQHVIGSVRQLSMVEHHIDKQQCHLLPKFHELEAFIGELNGDIAVLASGDPLFYGVGKWLREHFANSDNHSVQTYPAVSSLQIACHRLGKSLQDLEVVSLHGRAMSDLLPLLKTDGEYLLLTDGINTPEAIANFIVNQKMDGELSVLERLGYPDERITHFSAKEPNPEGLLFNALNICYLKLTSMVPAKSVFLGLPDEAFISEEGSRMMTKKAIRMNVLSLLDPKPSEIGWDVGAGIGSVSIEWALLSNSAIYAIESVGNRVECIKANKEKFEAASLEVVQATAPEIFHKLPAPNSLFIGGCDGSMYEMILQAFQFLLPGGRMVVSAVTEESKLGAFACFNELQQAGFDCELFELGVKQARALGKKTVMQPMLPVTLFKVSKP